MKKKFISNIARPWDPTGQFFAAPFYSSDENATSFKQWALPLIFSTFPRSALYDGGRAIGQVSGQAGGRAVIQLERHYLICEHANEALMGMCGVGIPICARDGEKSEYVCGIWN